MSKVVGVNLNVITSRLSKTNSESDGSTAESQVKSIAAHNKVSAWTYNMVTAVARAYSQAEYNFVQLKLREYLGCFDPENPSEEEKAKVEAFNDAAKWVSSELKKEKEQKILPKNFVPLSQRDSSLRYKKKPTPKTTVDASSRTTKEIHQEVVKNFDITISEAIAYHRLKNELYKKFREAYGDDYYIWEPNTVEKWMRLIAGCSTSPRYDGETLYLYPTAKQKTLGAKPISYSWFSEVVKEQLAAHPAPFYFDGQVFKVQVSEDDEDRYTVPSRVLVMACKDVTQVISKYRKRFFTGGNLKAGLPKFRSFSADQNFAASVSGPTILVLENPSGKKYIKKLSEEYYQENGRHPSKKQVSEWKKIFITAWAEKHPSPRLAETSVIYLGPNLGRVKVSKHDVLHLHELMKEEKASLSSDFRFSTSKDGSMKVTVSVMLPDSYLRDRPVSYYLNEDPEKNVGIDVGVISTGVLSNGYNLPNISRNVKWKDKGITPARNQQEQHFQRQLSYTDQAFLRLQELEEKKRLLQKDVSLIYDRTKKSLPDNSSKGEVYKNLPKSWHVKQQQISSVYKKMDNIRTHHVNVIAKLIASNYDLIGVEDLNVIGLLAKNLPKVDELGNFVPNGQSAGKGLRKALASVGVSNLITLITQKANYYGSTVQKVDRWYASTLTCSSCGVKKSKKDFGLASREFVCEHCGVVIDRDENAAVNIRREAEKLVSGGVTSSDDIVNMEEDVKEMIEKAIESVNSEDSTE